MGLRLTTKLTKPKFSHSENLFLKAKFYNIIFIYTLINISVYAMETESRSYVSLEEKQSLWIELGLEYANYLSQHQYLGDLNWLFYPELCRELEEPLLMHHQEINDGIKLLHEQIAKLINILETTNQSETITLEIKTKLSEFERKYLRPIDKKLFPSAQELYDELYKNGIDHIAFTNLSEEKTLSIDSISIRFIEKINGYGAFAEQDFEKGDLIGFYNGEIFYRPLDLDLDYQHKQLPYYYKSLSIAKDEFEEAVFLPKNTNQNYLIELSTQHPFFFGQRKEFSNKNKYALIIDSSKKRNELAFINHSDHFDNTKFIRALKVSMITVNGIVKAEEVKVEILVVAQVAINKGEQILINYGYPESILQNKLFLDLNSKLECYNCKSINKKLKKCSKCKVAYYCSPECQKKDWNRHKKLCH